MSGRGAFQPAPVATQLATATPLADTASGAVGTSAKAAKEDHAHPRVGLNLQLAGTFTATEGALVTLSLGVRRYTTTISGLTTSDRLVAALAGTPQNGVLQDIYVSATNTVSVGVLVPVLGVASTISVPMAIYKVV